MTRRGLQAMLLVIDNYDSFTYNLVQYLGELGEEIEVRRNDEIGIDGVAELQPERIVISPGPGTPDDAGISMKVIERFGSEIPILGVCLGHQSIGQVFGGCVVRAPKLFHGKSSRIQQIGRKSSRDSEAKSQSSASVLAISQLARCSVVAWCARRNSFMGNHRVFS